jgi:hypothetical protein
MAAGGKCNGVFNGKTPNLISKTADKTVAHPGDFITFTISFTSTGAGSNVVTDCYRVGNGSDSALNALVTGFNASKTSVNGPKGTLQHVTFQIQVPTDPSLLHHSIVDRAKATKGSKESRSQVVSVSIEPIQSSPCTTCGGTTGGGTTGGGTTVQGKQVHKKTSVKGATLAHTGPVSAKAAFLGSLMIMVGLVTRIRRSQTASPMVETADNSGSSYLARYDSYLRAALKR